MNHYWAAVISSSHEPLSLNQRCLRLPLQSQPPALLFVWPAHAALPGQPVLLVLPSVSAHHRDGVCIHRAAQVHDIHQAADYTAAVFGYRYNCCVDNIYSTRVTDRVSEVLCLLIGCYAEHAT